MSRNGHLSLQDLAALAEGRLPGEAGARGRQHVTECPSCLDAYTTAVEVCLQPAEVGRHEARPDLVAVGRAMAQPRAAGRAAGDVDARPRMRPRRRMARTLTLSGAAAVVAVGVLAAVPVWRSPRGTAHPTHLSGVALAPLQSACLDMSAYLPGALVLPGGEEFAGTEYRSAERSAHAPQERELRETLAALEDLEAKGGLFSPELAYWLGVGYLAVGDLTTARIHLDQALRRFPDRVELLLLDAVYANRNNELALAEQRLRQVLAAQPRNELARLDLGLLLARDAQRREESTLLLGAIARRGEGPLPARARRAMDEPAASP